MTDERAMEILDPDHLEHYESIEPIIEACRIGMEAIRKVKELRAENAALKERLEKSYAKDTYDWAKDAGERLLEQVILKGQGWRRL